MIGRREGTGVRDCRGTGVRDSHAVPHFQQFFIIVSGVCVSILCGAAGEMVWFEGEPGC